MPYFLLSFSSWLDNALLPLAHLLSRSLLLANALWLVEWFMQIIYQAPQSQLFSSCVILKWRGTFLSMSLLSITAQWKGCECLRWGVVCELLCGWTDLSLGKRREQEQSDPIYTGVTIVPSVSQVPWFVRAAATANIIVGKALHPRMFAQMGQGKVTYSWTHHLKWTFCSTRSGQLLIHHQFML